MYLSLSLSLSIYIYIYICICITDHEGCRCGCCATQRARRVEELTGRGVRKERGRNAQCIACVCHL